MTNLKPMRCADSLTGNHVYLSQYSSMIRKLLIMPWLSNISEPFQRIKHYSFVSTSHLPIFQPFVFHYSKAAGMKDGLLTERGDTLRLSCEGKDREHERTCSSSHSRLFILSDFIYLKENLILKVVCGEGSQVVLTLGFCPLVCFIS